MILLLNLLFKNTLTLIRALLLIDIIYKKLGKNTLTNLTEKKKKEFHKIK